MSASTVRVVGSRRIGLFPLKPLVNFTPFQPVGILLHFFKPPFPPELNLVSPRENVQARRTSGLEWFLDWQGKCFKANVRLNTTSLLCKSFHLDAIKI